MPHGGLPAGQLLGAQEGAVQDHVVGAGDQLRPPLREAWRVDHTPPEARSVSRYAITQSARSIVDSLAA
jgi:hypothetical protein